ncbi:helix-turn-helix domain-containing protein [Kineococcus rhizosphaerae]|uniref:XRE family transcriptional regulator n=1 Tax=Kineococcus rhizosphaerae TaxID=559628 RepID=A0A2T0R713_9ACTN|nr:cupin domain-containing protein [Kineococcus rhizosphaerae]PRY16920.1 XRE family transcriptional regulator [Kineococcus rhizosphaerae]
MDDTGNEGFAARLARELRAARLQAHLSTAALAAATGVSRGAVLKVESGTTQPSAALLGRLCGPLGLTLSSLFARVEGPERQDERVVRAAQAPVWTDPATGYRRRSLSPAGEDLELTEIELPAGSAVTYPAAAYARIHQQVWVLEGVLALTEGATEHLLGAGDCLALGPAADCTFRGHGDGPARYLVVTAPA